MDPAVPKKQILIAALEPHIDSAIRDSPCTCAHLRRDRVQDLALRHGFGPDRIANFLNLSDNAQSQFSRALLSKRRDPKLASIIDKTYHTVVTVADVPEQNVLINRMFQECGLADLVCSCEEVAVSYTAILRYLWGKSTRVRRFTRDESELENMLRTMTLYSIGRVFVSTSLTASPWFTNYPISYTIQITDAYRKHAIPLTYTSVFAVGQPETTDGLKPYLFFEDEIRFKNHTPIEPGTIDITFHPGVPLPPSRVGALASKYSRLGTVRAP